MSQIYTPLIFPSLLEHSLHHLYKGNIIKGYKGYTIYIKVSLHIGKWHFKKILDKVI